MLDREFFARPATDVAPALLGSLLTVDEVTVRITEVEAYLGDTDPGSHAFRGAGKRNAMMFGPPCRLYTYFSYGMHVCANVVCSPEGEASAVLLRGAEVVCGVDAAQRRRITSRSNDDLARGPARLCVALGITLDDGGADLDGERMQLRLPSAPLPYKNGPRTGVSGIGGTADYPWRFWLPGESSVSPYRASAARKRP